MVPFVASRDLGLSSGRVMLGLSTLGASEMKKRTGRNAILLVDVLPATASIGLQHDPHAVVLLVGGVFIVFPLTVGFLYGQIGSKVQYKLTPDSPAIVITATEWDSCVFLRGSSIVGAGPPGVGNVCGHVLLPSPIRPLP